MIAMKFLSYRLGQLARNARRPWNGMLTTNKGWYRASGTCETFSLFCCSVFSKKLAPCHTTLFARCRVCTFCWRRHENAVAAVEDEEIWSGRKTALLLHGMEPQVQDWFHQQIGRWSPRLLFHAGLRDKLSRIWSCTSAKIEMAGSYVGELSRLDCLSANADESVNGGA